MMHACKLVADLALFQNDKVFLVKYKDTNKYDHQLGWFLPDDLLSNFEHPDSAAKRISVEQLGVALNTLKLSFIESFKGNDQSWHLVFHFKSILKENSKIKLSNDIEEAKWFGIDDLPKMESVAHHGWALNVISKMIKG